MARKYEFDLPYDVPFFGVGMAISELKEAGAWKDLPGSLRNKIECAQRSWAGVSITQEDCDLIPDEMWEKIAERLNLKWSKA